MIVGLSDVGGRDLRQNPFATTKASDFSDVEISETWVEWPIPGGFADLMHVQSPMPRLIKGGKGTGRTHVLRHFSSSVQAIRATDGPLSQVVVDQVLGVYAPCSGLNSSRFRGRGIEDDIWQAMFVQYADIWLAQAALGAFRLVMQGDLVGSQTERAIVEQILALFLIAPGFPVKSLNELGEWLFELQKGIDRAIAFAVLNRGLPNDFTLCSSPGELVFGVPQAIREHCDALSDVTFLYLIDEFENFSEAQQRYVNSLVREALLGVSFMIGVRTFGLRTLQTLSAGEENKRGSEFEEIDLDRKAIGTQRRAYEDFCGRVIVKRLVAEGFVEEAMEGASRKEVVTGLRSLFEVATVEDEEAEMKRRYLDSERPHLKRLRRQLSEAAGRSQDTLRIVGNEEEIVGAIQVPESPMLEKANTLLLYRAWYRGHNLVELAEAMRNHRALHEKGGQLVASEAQKKVLRYFATDLRAQMVRDMRLNQTYSGIDQFVAMSVPLPRNLLVILKNIYRWSVFRGEEPFRGSKVSIEAQRLGVREAAEWFLADAKPIGEEGDQVLQAMQRLGEMFRLFRFSDKPVESSLATFSGDVSSCSSRARSLINVASDRSLLVRIEEGQKDRNTGIVEPKFQMNGLLSPLWDLPTARRGTVHLSSSELEAIFNPPSETSFRDMLNNRLARMKTPFSRVRHVGQLEPVLFRWEDEV